MPHAVVDLFSGAGGMSCGFQRHPSFEVVGAVDAEVGKPSAARGSLGCNASYERNVGVAPLALDLATIAPEELRERLALDAPPAVLSACAPCTGFTRTLARNHLVDDARNSLVSRVGEFARALRPTVVVMENARELLTGRFAGHYAALRASLEADGYEVGAAVHLLSDVGLPQRRERALVVAVADGLPLHTLAELWEGLRVREPATSVRHAIATLPPVAAGEAHPDDPMHVSPRFVSATNRARLRAIPRDGGSWIALRDRPELLTPSMRRKASSGAIGSHPDVYGRMAWDRPAPTIKRECGHVGNGRYAHPEQDRLCTVRELALLQGFPDDYVFEAASLANLYRHVGDAVPPLVAHQIACLVDWILGGPRPTPEAMVLDGCSLTPQDIVAA